MLHVILHILAIIGIVLLCILGLLLLLILLVLFVPVRYKVKGSKDDNGLVLTVRVSYLLHMLSARFDYPSPGKIIVRLFGIRVFDPGKKKAKDQTAEDNKETPLQQESMEAFPQPESTEKETPPDTAGEEEIAGEPKEEGKKETKEKISLFRHPILWLQAMIQKIKDIIKKIRYTIRTICDKIKYILENVTYYKDVLTRTENQLLYRRLWDRVLAVFKSIRPRVLRADVKVGTGSPDTTGYLLALYSMLRPLLGNTVNIEADFEEAVFLGSFYAKGKITIFTILLQAGKIFFDKQLRSFIKQLKREEV